MRCEMNPDTYLKIRRYLSQGSYPQGATKADKYSIRRRAAVYLLDEGALYYRKGKRLVVYDKEEAKQIFNEFHVSAADAHCGIVKTRNAVCKKFYWPGVTTDIHKWVGECLECQSIIAVKLETDSIPIEAGECTESQTSVFTIKEESDPTPIQLADRLRSWGCNSSGPLTESEIPVSVRYGDPYQKCDLCIYPVQRVVNTPGAVGCYHCSARGTGECMESQAIVSTIKKETDPTSSKSEECMESQLNVVTIEETETNTTPLEASQPFEFVGIYLIGKVAKTKTGNKFICVMVDYYTRWSEAFALPSKTAANVAGCIMKFFYRFGAPKRIFIGQSQEFINKLNKVLCKSLGGQHRLCVRHYPQTNELFEKLNETVQRALSELVSQRPGSWDMDLDAMMFVLRTKKRNTTEFSPFFLLFGIEARHPSEIP